MKNGYIMLNLQEFFNADAISYDSNREDGGIGLRLSIPAEELPESNSNFMVQNVPFLFPSKQDGDLNNIECSSETITFNLDVYSKIHIIGCCDNGSFLERLAIGKDQKLDIYEVGFSNFTNDQPLYNEVQALYCSHCHIASGDILNFKPSLWKQVIVLNKDTPINKIVLPDNPCYHIFAITLEKEI